VNARDRTIFQNVLIVYTKYYELWTMFDDTTPPQIWRVFLRHCTDNTWQHCKDFLSVQLKLCKINSILMHSLQISTVKTSVSILTYMLYVKLLAQNDFRDVKHGVLKLMVRTQKPLCTIYRVTSHLHLLALSISTCSPNMSYVAQTIREIWKKKRVGALSPADMENFSAWALSSCS